MNSPSALSPCILARALQGNPVISSLGLRGNAIGPLGMQELATLLSNPNCNLLDLQIKGNNIGDLGASALANALPENKSMRVCPGLGRMMVQFVRLCMTGRTRDCVLGSVCMGAALRSHTAQGHASKSKGPNL